MTLAEKQQQLVDDLTVIPDGPERLSVVVDRARRLPPLPETERTEAHRVRGCISQVWLLAEAREGRLYFRCDADGPLVKGLVHLVADFFSGATSLMRRNSSRAGIASASVALPASRRLRSLRAAPALRSAAMISRSQCVCAASSPALDAMPASLLRASIAGSSGCG